MITVTLTQKDIREGKVRDCFRCPVVLAVRRAFPGKRICAGHGLIYVRRVGCQEIAYKTPRAVHRFMFRFDSGKPVKPFSFRLRTPWEVPSP